jgi:hypothetical protein
MLSSTLAIIDNLIATADANTLRHLIAEITTRIHVENPGHA